MLRKILLLTEMNIDAILHFSVLACISLRICQFPTLIVAILKFFSNYNSKTMHGVTDNRNVIF